MEWQGHGLAKPWAGVTAMSSGPGNSLVGPAMSWLDRPWFFPAIDWPSHGLNRPWDSLAMGWLARPWTGRQVHGLAGTSGHGLVGCPDNGLGGTPGRGLAGSRGIGLDGWPGHWLAGSPGNGLARWLGHWLAGPTMGWLERPWSGGPCHRVAGRAMVRLLLSWARSPGRGWPAMGYLDPGLARPWPGPAGLADWSSHQLAGPGMGWLARP
jgi:hypothetical protein